ncbi:hypothetical protein BDY24DRAFT_50770 [Mrakia frigida]|uniref:uncharacterized protein n=1 Tax=Mrakia frigida TaxID=29902 RepID=UPI003FCC04CC
MRAERRPLLLSLLPLLFSSPLASPSPPPLSHLDRFFFFNWTTLSPIHLLYSLSLSSSALLSSLLRTIVHARLSLPLRLVLLGDLQPTAAAVPSSLSSHLRRRDGKSANSDQDARVERSRRFRAVVVEGWRRRRRRGMDASAKRLGCWDDGYEEGRRFLGYGFRLVHRRSSSWRAAGGEKSAREILEPLPLVRSVNIDFSTLLLPSLELLALPKPSTRFPFHLFLNTRPTFRSSSIHLLLLLLRCCWMDEPPLLVVLHLSPSPFGPLPRPCFLLPFPKYRRHHLLKLRLLLSSSVPSSRPLRIQLALPRLLQLSSSRLP